MTEFITTAFLLFTITDPVGNLPLFISHLDKLPSERYRPIVLRESLFAFLLLLLFMIGGNRILTLLSISEASISLAGGIILFMIAIKLVFGSASSEADVSEPGALSGAKKKKMPEPFIVPLSIPFIAGPGAISTVVMIGTQHTLWMNVGALLVALAFGTLLLLSGRWLCKVLGMKFLSAMETLMGLLLSAMAIELLIKGIKIAFLE